MTSLPARLLCLALASALLGSSAHAAPDSCIQQIGRLASKEGRFSRFIIGVKGPPARQLITTRPIDPAIKGLMLKERFSCASVASGVARLLTGAVQNPVTPFDSKAFAQALDAAVQNHQPTLFRFRIPSTLKITEQSGKVSDLGHHWALELAFDGNHEPSVFFYAAFEDQYTLVDWLKDTPRARHALGTGGRPNTVAFTKRWAVELQGALDLLRHAGTSNQDPVLRQKAYADGGAAFERLFGVSWDDMEMDPVSGLPGDESQVEVLFGAWPANATTCGGLVDTLLQQASFSCVGDLCS